MPRHRAPSSPARSLPILAATGAAIGGSWLTPSTAMAAPTLVDPEPALQDAGDAPASHALPDPDDRDRSADARPARHQAPSTVHRGGRHRAAEARHPRPMTSGERQYRNNCRHGLVADQCEMFDANHLLQRGINPTL